MSLSGSRAAWFSAHIGDLFTELPLDQRIAASGYDGLVGCGNGIEEGPPGSLEATQKGRGKT
ncbi:hypothetical protein [Bosea sp. (in: a-proteobacteria)]|uniref:hypothetical protein n=1 Tax=Bosea sp. (in: a-proteobacteria) TaxID=1871050 RepID=UPI002611FAEA|nr:hypothetical protein [Bosea sp. (in: a-proteobacteria)]MCO5091687.1 hypothetical protein [Bosea sp. (in: a-proteobacteria)]